MNRVAPTVGAAGLAAIAKGGVHRGGMPSAHAAAAAALLTTGPLSLAVAVIAAVLLIDATRYHQASELAVGALLGATVGTLART